MNIRGYTLLEVSLFLAISGGLTLVALVGLGPRLTNVRFTSAMRGLQESVTKQISASELGQNASTTKFDCTIQGSNLAVTSGSSSSSSCVYVGRLAVFTGSTVNYRSIVALRTSSGCGEDAYSFAAIYNCNYARVMSTSSDKIYNVTNGVSQISGTVGYGFVKSPDNNSVYRFILQSPSPTEFQLSAVTASLINTDTKICYQLSRRKAHLIVSSTSAEPKLVFNGVCP